MRSRGSSIGTRAATLALVLAAVVGACARAPAPSDRPVAVVLFDISGSTANGAVHRRYLDDFGKIAAYQAAREGLLFGDLIDENPLAHAALPITADFLLPDRVRGNRLYESAARAKMVKGATAQAGSMLARKPAAGTDIFGAILLADRIFNREARSESKYLVLLSDMFNTTRGANLYLNELGRDDVAALIGKLRNSGRLPDLRGVKVYVAGAGVQGGAAARADRILAVERFWKIYFAATGAELAPGNYAGRLLVFP